ncbi:MAG: hypothetical protein HGB14_09775, partial [Anaerolineaceae bacterium]|nr:hypothetical protein [Anaerolineaceae bacterium]
MLVGEGIFVAVLVDVVVIVDVAVKIGANVPVFVEEESNVFGISVRLFGNGLQATIKNKVIDDNIFIKQLENFKFCIVFRKLWPGNNYWLRVAMFFNRVDFSGRWIITTCL